MMRRNTIWFGVIQGLGFPIIFFFILIEVNNLLIQHYFGRPPGLSVRFIAILSIGSNLIPVLVANRNGYAKTMRGIMTGTLLLTAVVIAVYWQDFFFG